MKALVTVYALPWCVDAWSPSLCMPGHRTGREMVDMGSSSKLNM